MEGIVLWIYYIRIFSIAPNFFQCILNYTNIVFNDIIKFTINNYVIGIVLKPIFMSLNMYYKKFGKRCDGGFRNTRILNIYLWKYQFLNILCYLLFQFYYEFKVSTFVIKIISLVSLLFNTQDTSVYI